MAKYEESFLSKMSFSNVLERAYDVPLDRSSIFDSYDDAVKYAKGDGSDKRKLGKTSYIGQIITVYSENGVKTYQINHERNIEELGNGTFVAETEQEIANIASKENNIGRFVYEINNKKFYFIVALNQYEVLFAINQNDIIIDSGDY